MTELAIPKIEEEALKDFRKQLYSELGGNVILILLFGSKARGNYKKSSDIDILVILKNPNENQINYIYGLVMDLIGRYKVYLSVKIFSEKEFDRYKNIPTIFISNVLREGIKM